MKTHIIYDGSFEGYLTAVFDVYFYKLQVENFYIDEAPDKGLFDNFRTITTEKEKAIRVKNGLITKGSKNILSFIYTCFLSEKRGIEVELLYAIECVFNGKSEKLQNYGDPLIANLQASKKQMGREIHRMHAFVRFQETKDQLFVALVNPDFNVLPLAYTHFVERYPAMDWYIYDVIRTYGVLYQNGKVSFTKLAIPIEKLSKDLWTTAEDQYQNLWKQYFKSVNISERNNEKLHLQHVPRRYWSFLSEKDEA